MEESTLSSPSPFSIEHPLLSDDRFSKQKSFIRRHFLLILAVLALVVFFTFVLIYNGLNKKYHPDLSPCQECNTNIVSCPYSEDTCEQCVKTSITRSTGNGGCLQINVICSESTYPVSIQLKTPSGEVITVDQKRLGPLACSPNGWRYQGKTVTSVTCINSFSQQSPIDFNSATVIPNPALVPARFNYTFVKGDISEMVVNTNSTGWRIDLVKSPSSVLTESQLIDGIYKPAQVHMHWNGSPNATEGSEHTVDGKHSRAEIHMVFYNKTFPSFDEALGKRNGVHVVGLFVHIGAENNQYSLIDKALNSISLKTGGTVSGEQLKDLDLSQLLPAKKDYFSYRGSLTTKPFTRCVDWTVLKSPITITQKQMDTLVTLTKDISVRETQPVTSPIFTSP